jgi:hypothetical protein
MKRRHPYQKIGLAMATVTAIIGVTTTIAHQQGKRLPYGWIWLIGGLSGGVAAIATLKDELFTFNRVGEIAEELGQRLAPNAPTEQSIKPQSDEEAQAMYNMTVQAVNQQVIEAPPGAARAEALRQGALVLGHTQNVIPRWISEKTISPDLTDERLDQLLGATHEPPPVQFNSGSSKTGAIAPVPPPSQNNSNDYSTGSSDSPVYEPEFEFGDEWAMDEPPVPASPGSNGRGVTYHDF